MRQYVNSLNGYGAGFVWFYPSQNTAVVIPDSAGIGFTAKGNRFHFTADSNKLDYVAQGHRMHYKTTTKIGTLYTIPANALLVKDGGPVLLAAGAAVLVTK